MNVDEYFKNKNILVTGGCGFIGSHIIDYLIPKTNRPIIVVDYLKESTTEYIDKYIQDNKVKFYQIDIRETGKMNDIFLNNKIDVIIHLAAQTLVPVSVKDPYLDFDINMIGSFNLLELSRKYNVKEFIFAASGGTVYGETDVIPTPENIELNPISIYGASKGAFELYMRAYSHLYNIKCTSMRFGNVFGPRSIHGVIHDFYKKLSRDPTKLLILGNGQQEKSYLYIDDCVNGFITASTRDTNDFQAYNMAGKGTYTVISIADIISSIMKVNPEYEFTGGDRGWPGDVRKGSLDTTKLQSIGWNVNNKFEEAVEKYILWLSEYYSE